jgi:hypothetical protein
MHELGFDFVSLASDSRLLALKSRESLAEIRGERSPDTAVKGY